MILVAGKALMDFMPSGEGLTPHTGAFLLNTAVGLARLELPAGFLGHTCKDLFGQTFCTGVTLLTCEHIGTHPPAEFAG